MAFYLPQYHPTPENDAFWGKGFTEWTNVTRARPRFAGHDQPHLPADLGFYDLRLAEVRAAQAELARGAGFHGFAWYHYWFHGRRVLNRPFDEVLASGAPDFPFMLVWANENWTRAWDGGARQVLIGQRYSDADTVAHARHLAPAFADPRYVRVGGRPAFAVYDADDLPDPRRWTGLFRQTLAAEGIEPYLIRVERYLDTDTRPPAALGFDAALEFQPFSRNFRRWLNVRPGLRTRIARRLGRTLGGDTHHDLAAFAAFDACHPGPAYTSFPGVCPSWDNSARRPPGRAIIFRGAEPDLLARWLSVKTAAFVPSTPDENLVFVNAWNEWAEGNHLEPCQAHGHDWLDAVRRGFGAVARAPAIG